MLRHRPESNLENLFFGSLFVAASTVLAHGLGVSVVYPLMSHSESISSIANGFAQLWIG